MSTRHAKGLQDKIAANMIPEIKNFLCKVRLKEMEPSTLKDRLERDLITIYKLVSNMEKTDRQYIILLIEDEADG